MLCAAFCRPPTHWDNTHPQLAGPGPAVSRMTDAFNLFQLALHARFAFPAPTPHCLLSPPAQLLCFALTKSSPSPTAPAASRALNRPPCHPQVCLCPHATRRLPRRLSVAGGGGPQARPVWLCGQHSPHGPDAAQPGYTSRGRDRHVSGGGRIRLSTPRVHAGPVGGCRAGRQARAPARLQLTVTVMDTEVCPACCTASGRKDHPCPSHTCRPAGT